MDTTLKKLLKKSENIADHNMSIQISDIVNTLQNNKNCMVVMDDGPYKINLITNLLHEYISKHKSIWLATSPTTLSPFKLYGIRAGLGSYLLSVICHFEYVKTNSCATLWSVDLLRNNIDAICSDNIENLPNILVLENLDMLEDERIGPCIEQVILGLPLDIAIVAFISPVSNRRQIIEWLIKTRNGSWGELENFGNSEQLLTYLTPDYDLTPLLQKKKIATKVKLSLKENNPIKYFASKSFIAPLIEKLKQENLTPTLIVMPSKELCNQALQNCPKTRDNVSDILSNPQITVMFERYPILKDQERVVAALYKKVGSVHSDNHFAWSEMVERLLSLNLIEAVFTTMYDAQALSVRVKSVVFTTSQITLPEETKVEPVSSIEFRRICQLTESIDTDRGCVILVHGEDIDITRLKDIQLIPSLSAIKSKFQCNTQAILALAGSTNRGVQKSVMMSLWAEQKQFEDTSPLIEQYRQLEELIPEAKCGDARNALSIIEKTQQFKFEIDQCKIKLDKSHKANDLKAIKKKMAVLEFIVDNFPCKECVHQKECQELRYKKIRLISNQYSEMVYQMKASASILEVTLVDEIQFLMNMEFLDSEFKLTPKGKIALQSGVSNPFYITEVILNKKNFPWSEDLAIPALAGFIELGQTPILINDFVDEPLRFVYQCLEDYLYPVREQLYLNGVILPEPSFAQSALVRALENGIGLEVAAEKTGLSIGTILRLLHKTKYLGSQFGICPGNIL